ncbi:MAG: 40S ribosomal S12 [Lasallia pustulata]|uniref:40S ribosomal protein S12 n=1 Tax=Lasallia pustulata TaxID=136370 RepID=A0A5M8PG58_9LECA|nr:MAG: 40S ribosomal S12 [Lasallia pustulata]
MQQQQMPPRSCEFNFICFRSLHVPLHFCIRPQPQTTHSRHSCATLPCSPKVRYYLSSAHSPNLQNPQSPSHLPPTINQLFEDHPTYPEIPQSTCRTEKSPPPPTDVAAADEVEISADASASKGQMSVLDALKGVLKLALIHDGLARGLREASKALDRRQAHMCVLNEACEEEAYKKLVVALCSEHKIPLIKVPDGKQLGEWAGLCVLDREGNARKVVNCSCVVVRDWGEESQERSILLNYFQTEQ